ncbi:MAG: alpha/beta fold hydrolase [Nitrospirae bacterium]|nr:alpha/beta fold hydrolase [Candidatus Manganitrophaceae bacterium]
MHLLEGKESALARMPGARSTDILLAAPSSETLIYLIHGVTGTPLEMKYLGRRLFRHGWNVYLPTLPGHCSRYREMVDSDEKEWLSHVEMQLSYARLHCRNLFVAGLSAGALLALEASLRVPVEGIGVFSPTLFYDGWNVPWTLKLLPFGIKCLPNFLQRWFFHIDGAPYGIKDPALQGRIREAYHPVALMKGTLGRYFPRAHGSVQSPERSRSSEAVGYPLFSLKTLADLDRMYAQVRDHLHRVTAPTLILQAKEDDFTSPKNAEFIYRAIASEEKELILLDDCYHVITVDKQRDRVAEEMARFVERQSRPSENDDLDV